MAVIPRIPNPGLIVINPKTGQIAPVWWRFFHDLMERTGGVGSLTILFQSDVGSVVQAWDVQLDKIAALAVTDGNFIVGDGSNFVAESGATARASLGLVIGTNVFTQRTFAASGGAFWVDGDGASGNPTIDVALQVFEVTVGQGDLASAAEKTLLDAATGETWKVLDIVLSADGTDFSGGGGDRLMAITDGTSTWSIIPAATLQTLVVARWGDTGMPDPATASHLFAASGSGTDIVAKYSGGTTDYTAGSLTLRITAYRTA
jgi:hypothetical protein